MSIEKEIKEKLISEGFSVEGAGLTDYTIEPNIEIRVMSRTEEHNAESLPPQSTDKEHYYFILHSAGMNKLWLFSNSELEACRAMDERDSSPYLVKNFEKLKQILPSK